MDWMKLRDWVAKQADGTGDDAQMAAAVPSVFERMRDRMMTVDTVDQCADGQAPAKRNRYEELRSKYEDYLRESD